MSKFRRAVMIHLARTLRARCSSATPPSAGLVLSRAIRIADSVGTVVMVTDSPSGPRSRVVQPMAARQQGPHPGVVRDVGTSPTTRKARDVAENGRCQLVFHNRLRQACVVADCAAVPLPARARRFAPLFYAFWPDGPQTSEPQYTVIRCVADRLEVWDALGGVAPQPFGLASAIIVRDDDGSWRLPECVDT